MLTDEMKELMDAAVLSPAFRKDGAIVFHTASKKDAEWLYSEFEPIAQERELEATGKHGVHRNFYLELDESDDHSLKDEDAYSWNTREIYRVRITPIDMFNQRVLQWGSCDGSPTDYTFTPRIAKVLYLTGAHENAGINAPYIEMEVDGVDTVSASLEEKNIPFVEVGGLYRFEEKPSTKFRAFAGVELPEVTEDV